MNVISHTKNELVLRPARNEQTWRSFVFNVSDVPALNEKPTPRVVTFRYGGCDYSMTWLKFNHIPCIGDVAIVHKDRLNKKRRTVA